MPVRELYEKGDYTKWPAILALFQVDNRSENIFYVSGYRMIFDNEDNLYFINSIRSAIVYPGNEGGQEVEVYYDLASEDDLIWPEELTGDVSGAYVITRIWQ